MPEFYVVTEDGESMGLDAPDATEAVRAAVREWGLEADPGYAFKVFCAEDALPFEFVLDVRSVAASNHRAAS